MSRLWQQYRGEPTEPKIGDATYRFREKFSNDLADAVKVALYRTALDERHAPIRNCLFCKNFDEANGEICHKSPTKSRPPARVIVRGCPAYDDIDDIPF